MTKRSQAHVRNPVLALPSAAALRRLDPTTRALLRQLLLDLRSDARSRAETSWRRRKPPMAAYWAAVAVYAGHIARALGKSGIGGPDTKQGRTRLCFSENPDKCSHAVTLNTP